MAQPADDIQTPSAAAATAPRGLGRIFVRGLIWGTGGLLVAKAGSAVQTVCTGWLLSRPELAAVAAGLSAAMVGDIFTDGGLRRVLITRGIEYDRLARTVFAIALSFNLLGCTLMLGTAGLYRTYHPEAVNQLVVYAIAMVIATLGTVQRCKLTIDLRYAQSTFLGTASSLLRNLLTVLFAWLGFGPLSFALPLIFVNVWEASYVRYAVGGLPQTPVDRSTARELIGQGKWVIFAAVGGSLITRGDYLVGTWLLSEDQRGEYYQAFQLATAVFAPLSLAAAAMVQPVMARLREDPARQSAAFLRVVRSTVFISVPLSMISSLVAPILIHLVWKGRWDSIAAPVQIIAATECVRQLLSISLAMLDARGQFHRSAALIVIDGLLTVATATVGCLLGSVLWLATLIAIQRTLISIAEAAYVHQSGGHRMRAVFVQVLPPLMLAAPLATLCVIASHRLFDPAVGRWMLAASAIPATIVYLAACRLFLPLRFEETIELVRSRLTNTRRR